MQNNEHIQKSGGRIQPFVISNAQRWITSHEILAFGKTGVAVSLTATETLDKSQKSRKLGDNIDEIEHLLCKKVRILQKEKKAHKGTW